MGAAGPGWGGRSGFCSHCELSCAAPNGWQTLSAGPAACLLCCLCRMQYHFATCRKQGLHAMYLCNSAVSPCDNSSLYIAPHARAALTYQCISCEHGADAISADSTQRCHDLTTNGNVVMHSCRVVDTVKMGCTCLDPECLHSLVFALPRCHGSAHDDFLNTNKPACSADVLCID